MTTIQAKPTLPTPVFENATGFDALFFNALDQFDQGFHVVVAKMAWQIGPCAANGLAPLILSEDLAPLLTSDQHYEDDVSHSVRLESDLAPFKPQCDVIVLADAHAPGGRAVAKFDVHLQVRADSQGSAPGPVLIDKHLHIYGPRQFHYRRWSWALSSAQPITQCTIRYEAAAGGACRVNAGDAWASRVPPEVRLSEPLNTTESATAAIVHQVAETNPLGVGFCRHWYRRTTGIDQIDAPQIEYPDQAYSIGQFEAVLNGADMPAPAGFGCIGRAWLPRRNLIGHFQDKPHWEAEEVPRLPTDFNFAYWNAAPSDQQCRYLQGGDSIRLVNLCPPTDPACHPDQHRNQVIDITLPQQALFLLAQDVDKKISVINLVIDTVVLNLSLHQLELVWRVRWPCDDTLQTLRLLYVSEPDQLARLAALQEE